MNYQNNVIDRKNAKGQLEKINDFLEKPHLLIGGLAVQQYVPIRNTSDIDLVCSFDVANQLIESIYTSDQWNVKDLHEDEERPSFQIVHRYKNMGEVRMGPKILERKAYDNIDYKELSKNAKPFSYKNKKFKNIIVPTASSLAYSKLISFLGRSDNYDKALQDLKDFVNLVNYEGFLVNKFWDLLRRSNSPETIYFDFEIKSEKFVSELEKCCLHSLSDLFHRTTSSRSSTTTNKNPSNSVYIAGPHNLITKNKRIARILKENDFKVFNPYIEVANKGLTERKEDIEKIRETCIECLLNSDFMIVDLDCYGQDTAWEIGFADAIKTQVIGYNENIDLTIDKRIVKRKLFDENFMHGWVKQKVFDDLEKLSTYCTNKSVYVIGSFGNDNMKQLRKSSLKDKASRLIFPIDYIENQESLTIEYPYEERMESKRHLENAGIVLVVLPRYGMDTSWQIGYATGLKKEIIGVVLEEDKRETSIESFWDHWMHGWKQKLRVTNIKQLVAILFGLSKYENRKL